MEALNQKNNKLKKEYEDLQSNPNASIGCTVGLFDKNDLFNWKVSLLGPKDSFYSGGIFFLKLRFPKDYPNNPPQIYFLTPIYHLNVCPFKNTDEKETLGTIYENLFNYEINKDNNITVKEILTKLYAIFYVQKENYFYGIDRKNEYENNKPLFELKARYFTRLYAGIFNLNKEINYSDKNWDFSGNKYMMKIKNYFFGKEIKINTNYNKEDDGKEITLLFNINGINEYEINCELGKMTSDVIKEVKNKFKINDNNALYIFDLRKLILDKSIGANGLQKKYIVTIISDYYNNFLK